MTSETVGNGNFWNIYRALGWGTAATLLVLPAAAMQFTSEVDWSVGDFIVAAMMFGIVGLGIELAVRVSQKPGYRSAAAIALFTGLFVFWANGAVGIIGNEDNPANLMFYGVIAIAIGGAFVARFRAGGMVRAMAGVSLAQFAVPFIAIAIWAPPMTVDLAKTIIFNSVFAAMWLGSALLFRRAARD